MLLATTKHSLCLNFDEKQFSKLLMSSPMVEKREQEKVERGRQEPSMLNA